MPATSRYEETAYFRNELESAKKENETLKRRIRELERMVHNRRVEVDSDAIAQERLDDKPTVEG